MPARAATPPGVAGGVEAQPGDRHVGVAGVGVDRDPLARAGLAVALQRAGDQRGAEQAAAVEGEADGAGAVVAVGVPGAVAAAPDVGGGGDRVGRGDRRLDRGRGVAGALARLPSRTAAGAGRFQPGARAAPGPSRRSGPCSCLRFRRPGPAPPARTTRPGCGRRARRCRLPRDQISRARVAAESTGSAWRILPVAVAVDRVGGPLARRRARAAPISRSCFLFMPRPKSDSSRATAASAQTPRLPSS